MCHYTSCTGSQTVGASVFSYTDSVETDDYPNFDKLPAWYDMPGTSCKGLTVQLAGDEWMNDTPHVGAMDYVRFIQSSGTTYGSVAYGKVASMSVALDGGPVYVAGSTSNVGGVHNNSILLKIAGTNCSTPDGVATGA
jgi:hypothetical protein